MHRQPNPDWIERGMIGGLSFGLFVGCVVWLTTALPMHMTIVGSSVGSAIGFVVGLVLSFVMSVPIPGVCTHCGYDTTDVKGDHCPECGWLLDDDTRSAAGPEAG